MCVVIIPMKYFQYIDKSQVVFIIISNYFFSTFYLQYRL